MKKILLAVLLIAPLSLAAQTAKFAHFDLQGTVEALPAYKTATAELQSLGEQYQKNLEDMQKELQTKNEKYTKEIDDAKAAGKPLPENIQKRYSEELQTMYEKLQQAAQDNEKSFTDERAKKMQPIIQKVMDAVNAVSKEGAYVYVIDTQTAQQANIFINTSISEDVTAKVKAKLGI